MNTKELAIDLLAASGKIWAESTKLPSLAKSSIKWSIDVIAKALKEAQSPDIETIGSAAEHYGVHKVVAIPMYDLNGQPQIVIRVYGGNPYGFFEHLKIQMIPENSGNDIFSNITWIGKEIWNCHISKELKVTKNCSIVVQ